MRDNSPKQRRRTSNAPVKILASSSDFEVGDLVAPMMVRVEERDHRDSPLARLGTYAGRRPQSPATMDRTRERDGSVECSPMIIMVVVSFP